MLVDNSTFFVNLKMFCQMEVKNSFAFCFYW
jgi:hypothetical protein